MGIIKIAFRKLAVKVASKVGKRVAEKAAEKAIEKLHKMPPVRPKS